MAKCFYVCFVLIPLVLGLALMIFALVTEYWTRVDYAKAKHHKELRDGTARSNGVLRLKKIKLSLPKYTSLYGECDDEFQFFDIWMPTVDYEIELLYNLSQQQQQQQQHQQVVPVVTPSVGSGSVASSPVVIEEESEHENELNRSRRQVTAAALMDHDECISTEKCAQLNRILSGACFCCSDRCCLLKTKMCDGMANCRDKSDEAENCPLRRLYFASRYVDNKYNCIRHQYNLWEFAKGFFDRNIMGNKVNTSAFCIMELMKQSNQSVKVFNFRVLTIVGIVGCIKFTFFCLITLIFVSCCHDLPAYGIKKRKSSLDDDSNGFNCGDHDFDQYSLSGGSGGGGASSGKGSRGSCCCKCNCLLCPFIFFSIFASLAALFAFTSLGTYLASAYHFKLNFLIYDPAYVPDYITKAYQYNAWLFDMYSFDFSFYALLLACLFYSIALISSVTIACHIQMSPAWRRRYADSYEVLEMHDMNANTQNRPAKPSTKNTYKKLSHQNSTGESAKLNPNSSAATSEDKKSAKKKPSVEMAKAVPESDEISLYDEAQTLTSPKTRLTIENSYE